MSAKWQQFSQGSNQDQGWNPNTGWNQNQNQGWDQNQNQNQWYQNNSNHNWNFDNNTGNTYNTSYQQQQMQPQQTQHTPAHTFPPLPPPATGQATPTQTYTAARTTHQTTRNHPYIQQQQTPPQHQRMIYTPPSTTSTNTPHTTPPSTQQPTPSQSNSSTQATQPQIQTPQTSTKHTTPHYVAIPDKWTQTTEHYDSNTNLGGPVYKQIQASSWSRRRGIQGQDPLTLPAASLLRYGSEDHAIRLLSQGKFVGIVPTRTVAESVFTSQLLKSLRDQNIDLDLVAEATHKGPVPSKQNDAAKFFGPLVQHIVDEVKAKQPVQNSLEQVQKLASTEAKLAKAQQKLQQHGIQISPQRNNTSMPDLPTTTPDQEQAQGSQPEGPTETPAIDEVQETEPPIKKPRRTKGRMDKEQDKDKQDNKMDLPTILHPTSATLHSNHPASHTDTKVTQWMDSIKDKKFHTHVKKVSDMLNNIPRKDRPNLVETAIRYGVPMDKVQQMSYKSLSNVVAAGAYYAI